VSIRRRTLLAGIAAAIGTVVTGLAAEAKPRKPHPHATPTPSPSPTPALGLYADLYADLY